MAAIPTLRAGILKPSGPDQVDISVINQSFDTIDSFLGAILVNDGVTPSNSQLFDGAIVKERTSGKVWVAQKNVGGGFDQNYIQLGAKTQWGTPGTATGWSQTYAGVPAFQFRRIDGKLEFRGSMYFAGTLPNPQSLFLPSQTIVNAVGTNATSNIRQTADLFDSGGGLVNASLTFLPTGFVNLYHVGTVSGVILSLDSKFIADLSIG